jgi:multiple sugar transport system substrate-binding protein
MVDLNFSIYGDRPSVLEGPLVDEFRKFHHAKVNVQRMPWAEAWPKLLDYAIHGGGPDISQIGAIWTSSLVAMNVIRAINPREVNDLGGQDVFYRSAWQNALASGSEKFWAIPFTTFTYVILYRRDILHQAGVDEQRAFVSAEAMVETLNRLKAAGITSPLVLPSGNPYRARVHYAASWVWGAGGEFVDEKDVLFDHPEAMAGLTAFFELYRFLSPSDQNLAYEDCVRRVGKGQAAVTIVGMQNWLTDPQEVEQLGTVPVPGVPWVGGSNLVIWSEAQTDISLDRTAFQLANYLTSQPAQMAYADGDKGAYPARIDALRAMTYPITSLTQSLDTTMSTGRAYKPSLIWVRMLNDLSRTFDRLTAEILSNPEQNVSEIINRPITNLANRFRLMLTSTR